jgi:hypothetical protein
VPKTLKTRTELEAMLLSELRKAPHCLEAKSVTVCRAEERSASPNWLVANFDSGQATMRSCAAMLGSIERRLQALYDLASDC